MTSTIAEGAGRMMLLMPAARVPTSHRSRMTALTRTGQAIEPMRWRRLGGMTGLDGLAQAAHQMVEVLVLGHGDLARTRERDRHLIDDRCGPAAHHQHPI